MSESVLRVQLSDKPLITLGRGGGCLAVWKIEYGCQKYKIA